MERNDIPIPYSGKATRKRKENNTNFKYPNGYFNPKCCTICSNIFTPNTPSERYCSEICKDEALADNYLKRNYGLSIENYRDLYISQNGLCKICASNGLNRAADTGSSVGLVVDHDHKTGKVRGLLCHTCNSALGQFKDSETILLSAIDYLNTPPLQINLPIIKIRSKINDLSEGKHLEILIDKLDNGLNRKELVRKYNITEAKVRGVIELKTIQAKKAFKKYCFIKESATTIETQETEEVEYTTS